jgi:hypothetical protein
MSLGLSSTGFSLWGLALASTKTHRLKPVLLRPANHARQIVC